MIELGQSYDFGVTLNVLDEANAVQHNRAQIDELCMDGPPPSGAIWRDMCNFCHHM